MQIFPAVSFSLLNGFLLMIPLLGLRFGIPAGMRKTALAELEFFPPVRGFEQIALKVYFVTNTFLIFSPLIANIQSGTYFSSAGWLIYILGLILMTISLINYCEQEGLKRKGIYRFSRNPMCIGYFLIFFGMALVIGSWLYLVIAVVYQIAVHGLILSEERWCIEKYGEGYQEYLENVPRYF